MITYVALALLASRAVASSSEEATNAVADYHKIFSRQSSPFSAGAPPTVCDDQCKTLKNASDAGCFTPECICTSQQSNGIFTCDQCIINLSTNTQDQQASLVHDLQASYDQYASSCLAQGHPVPNVTLAVGGDSSGTRASNAVSSMGVVGLACALMAIFSLAG